MSVSQKNLVHTVRSENENDITLNRYKYLMLVIQTRFSVNKAKRPPFQFCETNLKLSVNNLANAPRSVGKLGFPI